jgi:hypothetical protein
LKYFLVIVFLLGSGSVFSQILQTKLSGSEMGKSPMELFQQLEKQYPVKFFFIPEWFGDQKLSRNYTDETLETTLEDLLPGSDLSYIVLYDYAIIFSKDPSRELQREELLGNAKRTDKKITTKVIGDKTKVVRGKSVTIAGKVVDLKSQEPLSNVTIGVPGAGNVLTDARGEYSLSLQPGVYVLDFHYINYEEMFVDLEVYENGRLDMGLSEIPRLLEEVVVTDQQLSNVSGKLGATSIKMTDIKKMPAFLGEVDLIKQIQVLPGVTSVGEVSSGFNVRGGGVDQNLVLYDGVPIFNNSHVFGFFSAFSSDAIKDATFLKGGISSEYGGRISSVLNITSKEGNYEKWGAEGGIGLISSHITVGGPIKKNVSSVEVSVRSSYSDWLLKQFTTRYQNIQNSSVSFYDASIKLTQKLGANDKIAFSGYMSNDHFGLPSDTTFTWQNLMGSLKYDHVFNSRASMNASLGYGRYGYHVTDDDPTSAYKMQYRISYPTLKVDFAYEAGHHKINLGINSMYYQMQPTSIKPEAETSTIQPFASSPQSSVENAFFISDGIDVTSKFHIEAGIRLSLFSSLGPATIRYYDPDQPVSEQSVTDSASFASGKIIKNYFGPEPRLSLRYSLTQNSSIKVGYNRMYQYIHLISNSVAVTPIDIWQPSNSFFKPQIGDQISLGYFHDLRSNTFEASVEGFYKEVQNLLDFKNGADLVLNPHLETQLLRGHGKSYGIEFSLNKIKGRLTGSFNYTYSRSLKQVVSQFQGESINNGNYYPSNFDQPNIVNLNWKYGLSRRVSFTGNFTYHTGRPVTIPYSYSTIDNIPIVNFSERNQYRVPSYHRLDFALVIEGNHRRKKFWDGTWAISIYNVYARKNVYTVFYGKEKNGLLAPYRMSIVGTALPSISYRFKI